MEGGVPRGSRALPDPGKENPRFQMPSCGIPLRAAQPWGGGRAPGGREGEREGKGLGDAAKPVSPKGRKRGLLSTAEQI